MNKKYLLVLIFIIPLKLMAQKPSDLELWVGGRVNFKFNKTLSLDVLNQTRFDNKISTFDKTFLDFGLKIKLGKHFGLKPAYRFSMGAGNKFKHRVALDGTYKWSKKGFPFLIGYRMRFQQELFAKKTYLRNKIKVGYKLSKLVDPFLAYEIYFRFNKKNEFRVSRLTLGLDWRITKKLHVASYYRIQEDIFIGSPERQHIIGLMIDYKFRPKKKVHVSNID